MENQDQDSRKFLIEHKCGSMFTINLDTYVSCYREGSRFICPGCREHFEHDLNDQLLDFLKNYKNLDTRFAEVGLKITGFGTVETND